MANSKTVIRCEIDAGGITAARKEIEAYAQACQGAADRLRSMGRTVALLAREDDAAGQSVRALQASLAGVRDSLASAFIPIITTVAPLLARLCDMLATAVNYVAMFFAVLGGGSSYKRLVSGQNAFNKSLKAGGGAARRLVNNLAGLDELHLWQSPAGGSGGGGGGTDMEDMFEDVPIENAAAVREMLRDILWYAGAIGAALAAWRLARNFGADLRTALGLAMAAAGAVVMVKGYLDAWKNGFDLKNMTEMFGGLAAAVLGVGLAFRSWKAAGITALVGGIAIAVAAFRDAWNGGIDFQNMAGLLGAVATAASGAFAVFGAKGSAVMLAVGGIGSIVLALRDWKRQGELTKEAMRTLESGLLELGGSAAIFTGSAVPLVAAGFGVMIGECMRFAAKMPQEVHRSFQLTDSETASGAAALGMTIREHWDDIKAWTAETWETVKETVREKAQAMREKAVTIFNSVKEKVQTAVTAMRERVAARFEQMRAGMEEKMTAARDRAAELFESIKTGIIERVNAAREKVADVFETIRSTIQEKIENAKEKVSDAIEAIKGFFDFSWSLPPLKLPHFSITGSFSLNPPSIPHISVSWYARGGIVDGATLIGAGEAGREAIVPLERHTEWMDDLARRVARALGGARLAPALKDIASRLGDIPGAIQGLRMTMPAVAAGVVTPPKAAYMSGREDGLAETVRGLRALLAEPESRTAARQGASYTFIGELDGKVLFKKVIDEGQAQRRATGRNPFVLLG